MFSSTKQIQSINGNLSMMMYLRKSLNRWAFIVVSYCVRDCAPLHIKSFRLLQIIRYGQRCHVPLSFIFQRQGIKIFHWYLQRCDTLIPNQIFTRREKYRRDGIIPPSIINLPYDVDEEVRK